MIEPATDIHTLGLHPDVERVARLERVTQQLRALARGSDESSAHGRPILAETVRAWERDVAAARRQLHVTAAHAPATGPKAARR